MSKPGHRPLWVYALAVAALVLLLWIGWSDTDLYLPQDQVRESIRVGIRRGVQLLVQFVAPAVLVGFLVREAVLWARGGR